MQLITNNPDFLADYHQLKRVSLNPERHTAKNAYEHCEMVVDRVKHLAKLNHCSEEETAILVNLAFLHDIGKTTGTAKPEKSVELLARYREFDESFVSLIKYHDINLPWYISYTKDEAPTNKAWQKLSRRVDIRLLCIFMVADRVDCPGGWTNNKALMWFLSQCRKRGYLSQELNLDEYRKDSSGNKHGVEYSAGGTIFKSNSDEPQILAINVRNNMFELPKGHIESGEIAKDTAIREFQEETGISISLEVKARIRELTYKFKKNKQEVTKIVSYFLLEPKYKQNIDLSQSPNGTRDIRWLDQKQVEDTEWASDDLKKLALNMFDHKYD